MWHKRMPRALRLSVVAVGVLVLAGTPTATAAPAEEAGADQVTSSPVPTTTTTAPATTTTAPTTAAPTTTPAPTSEWSAPATTTTPTPSGRAGQFTTASRGGLSIIVGGQWGTIVPGSSSASGTLTTVTVTDNSSGTRGWVATASTTDFVGPHYTIPKSAVTYTATALAGELLGGSLSSKGAQNLATPKTVVERSGLYWPLEIITWTPALRVDYPGGAAVGTYTGTITISVA
ncbi:hypothetical protein ERC79_12215 [Rhodococcus sp. ABRD24]|uniref:hypothetical protein n=1 Tax=Rhodococcus sp. ABRD24 TaxID=2507582 RepID=UPI00103CC371|nr:hypothetical protein [Rhodococcus sp. ABRD24]QBJ96647.1 hypothetical protein ERC79_12215 [Rhodococcus sp. ABRD24]